MHETNFFFFHAALYKHPIYMALVFTSVLFVHDSLNFLIFIIWASNFMVSVMMYEIWFPMNDEFFLRRK